MENHERPWWSIGTWRKKINRTADESVRPFGHVRRMGTSFMRKAGDVKYGRLPDTFFDHTSKSQNVVKILL